MSKRLWILVLLASAPACSLFSERRLSTPQFIEESKSYAGLRILGADFLVRAGDQRLGVEATLQLANLGTVPITDFKFYIASAARHVAITRDGRPVEYERWSNSRYQKVLAIVADPPIAPGEDTSFRVDYSYEPPLDRQGSNCRMQPDAMHVFDSLWVPRVQPGEERPFDQFAYTMTIEVPDGETAITNGAMVSLEALPGVGLRYRYRCEEATHPFVAIGRYRTVEAQHGATTLTAYVHERYGEQGLKRGRQYLDFIAGLLDVYTRMFGPIELPRYRLISIDSERANFGINAGMLLSERHFKDLIPDGARLCVVAHELAHAWWANHVHSYGPGSGLVTEAMCNYAAAVGFGELFGADAERELYATYREFYRPVAADDIPLGKQDGYQEIYYTSTYNRGALILRMLEAQIGRPRFHEILRGFVATHGGESVQAQTFLEFIQASCDQDLATFFDEFIWGTALPDYRIVSVASGGAAGGSVVTVTNDGTGHFPVTVRMRGGQGEAKEERLCLGYRASQELRVPFVVSQAQVDPEGLLVQSSYVNDGWPRSPAILTGHVSRDGEKLTTPARVELWRKGSLPGQYSLAREVTCDAEGRFSIANVASDHYVVTAHAANCVPHYRTLDIDRNWSVEILLEPVISAQLLSFHDGDPIVQPLTAEGLRFVPSEPSVTGPHYVILNPGRSEEIVVALPEHKRVEIFPGALPAAPELDAGEPAVAFDPTSLGEIKLAARTSQDSLRAAFLRPGWYRAPFLP